MRDGILTRGGEILVLAIEVDSVLPLVCVGVRGRCECEVDISIASRLSEGARDGRFIFN